MFRKRSLGEHPDEEKLLLYLDGELPEGETKSVARHLLACWGCRTAAARLESAMQAFVETRRRSLRDSGDMSIPEDSAMLSRLRTAAASFSGAVPPPRRNGFVWHRWGVALAGIGVVCAVAWLGMPLREGSVPVPVPAIQLQARDILARAHAVPAEAPPQRFAVVAEGAAAAPPDWQELRSTLAQNGWNVGDPLSAGAFDRWRRSLPDLRETVRPTVLPDGSRGWEVQAERLGPQVESQIRAARVLLRAADYRPVRMVFAVYRKGRTRNYSVVPAPALRPRRVAASARIAERWTEHELVQSEFEVHYLLHRLNVCRRDFVEVQRSPAGVLITGVVDTAERKREIGKVLESVAAATVRIQSASEAARRAEQAPTLAAVAEDESLRLGSSPALLQPLLEVGLRSGLSRAEAQKQVLRLSNRAVLLADSIKLEAWVLHQLAGAFAPASIAGLGPGQRLLLEQMLRDHRMALGAAAAELEAALAQIPRPARPPSVLIQAPAGDLRVHTAFVQNEAILVNRLSGALFAGLNLPVAGPEEARAEFEARLAAIRAAVAGLDKQVAELFPPVP